MTRNELIYYTKSLIDEISPIDGLGTDASGEEIHFADFAGDKPIDDFVDGLLDESATEILLIAPTYYCESETIDASAIEVSSDNVGTVSKPDEFVKLSRFRLASWERAVNQSTAEGSEKALMQGNPYLRGGKAKPVVVEERESLMLYPAYETDKTSASSKMEYVKNQVAEDVNAELQKPLCWLTASKVYGRAGNLNMEKEAKEKAIEMISETKRQVI